MKLADYLTWRGKSATAFAAEIGVPPSTITRLLHGERKPGYRLQKRISNATQGIVSHLSDFEDNDGWKVLL